MEERRQYPRVAMDGRRALFADIHDAGMGQVRDISLGGVLIETPDACLKWLNAKVVVHMTGKDFLMAEGRVVRHYPGKYLAISFTDVRDPDNLRRLCITGEAA